MWFAAGAPRLLPPPLSLLLRFLRHIGDYCSVSMTHLWAACAGDCQLVEPGPDGSPQSVRFTLYFKNGGVGKWDGRLNEACNSMGQAGLLG